MSPEHDDELRNALDDLPRERMPPTGLEEAVVGALYDRGLLSRRPGGRSGGGRPGLRALLAVAAAVAVFVAGWAGGRATAADDPTGVPAGPRFLLLLYEGPGFRAPAPGAMDERVEEYREWAMALQEEGLLVAAEKLADGGRLITGERGDLRISSGVARSEHGLLAGYFLITAPSYERAVEVARSSPHLRYGGHVAVRRIEPT